MAERGRVVGAFRLGGSVRARLLGLGLAAVLPSLVGVLWLFAQERRDAVQRTEDQLLRLVEDARAEHEALLRLGGRVLQSVALVPDVVSGDRAACERQLAALAAVTPEIITPTRTNAQGVIDCVPGREPGTVVRDNPVFARTLASDSIVVGSYARSVSVPEAIVPLNLRMQDATGRPTGLVSVGVRMQWFRDLQARLDLPPGALVTMMDGTGLVLARSPEGGLVGRRLANAQLPRLMAAGETRGITDGVTVDGVPLRWAWVKLASPDERPVALSVALPKANIAAEANRELAIRLALIVAVLGVTWGTVSLLLPSLILRDLERLDAAAERVGRGDFTVRTGVADAPTELQRLADTIDAMAARLSLREERQLQAQKLESLGRLAGGVAHDFNNMLTAVMGNVEDVRDGLPAGDPARQQLDATLEAVRRSGQLTRQLLAFARRDGVSVTPLALREVLDDTAQLVRRTLGPDITVSVDCEPGLRVGGDRARLEQALVNLAFNARDAMPSGGTLRLRARHVSASEVPKEGATDQWVRLDVQDDGVGMTPEVRRRVFEPFFTTKEMGRGSGLGLSMVYAAMEQVGGATSIASEVGVGTTVSLWFPVRTDARAAAAADLHAAAPELPAAGPATLLLVEDDPAVRAVSARALRRAGYAVVEADDGVAGLEALSAAGAPFDLVISDVRMPRMGGAEFGAAVRRLMPDTPLLFLSGYQGEDRLEALLASPRTTLLAKPFRNQDLLATVAELLEAP